MQPVPQDQPDLRALLVFKVQPDPLDLLDSPAQLVPRDRLVLLELPDQLVQPVQPVLPDPLVRLEQQD